MCKSLTEVTISVQTAIFVQSDLKTSNNPKILSALEYALTSVENEILKFPMSWAPCYEALDKDGNEVSALSEHAVQYSVCGFLDYRLASHSFGSKTLIARQMAGRLLGLIAHRMLNYEDPENISVFFVDGHLLQEAGGSHCSIHKIDAEIGIVGAQDILRTLRELIPTIRRRTARRNLVHEFSFKNGTWRRDGS